MYGRESLTFDEVQSSLYYKDLNEQKEHKSSLTVEGLSVKAKVTKRDGKFDKKKGKSQKKSYSGDAFGIRCYHCKKESHTRKVCPERLMKVRIMETHQLFKMILTHMTFFWFQAATQVNGGLWIQVALGT